MECRTIYEACQAQTSELYAGATAATTAGDLSTTLNTEPNKSTIETTAGVASFKNKYESFAITAISTSSDTAIHNSYTISEMTVTFDINGEVTYKLANGTWTKQA